MILYLTPNDEVAILPSATSPAVETLEIVRVDTANSVYVKLIGGRMYSTLGGKELGVPQPTYIVAATDEHHAVLKAKRAQ